MLLERQDLLDRLGGFLGDAVRGSGSLVLVAGEAGAGKTSLVDAFVASLDDSTLTITGACDPLTTPRPLSPLLDFAADPGSGLSDIAMRDRQPIDIFGDVLDRLRTSIRPVAMVIEDIHWADDATLDFMRFVGRRVAESRSVLICTFRDDEVVADHPLRSVLGQLSTLPSTHRLAVPALSLDAVAELAADTDVEPQDLLDLTGGNAFFVTEVLAAADTMPPTVQDAVLARVARLPTSSQRVVEAVSIAPRSLDVAHAASLVGATDGDIDVTLTSGVLIGDGTILRFRHELARAAIENALPPARRLSLHQRMIHLLTGAAEPDLARLAHHALRANDGELVRRYAAAAARQAEERGSRREAISFYEGALAHKGDLDPREEARLRTELADQLHVIGRSEDAITQHRAVVELGRSLGDPLLEAGALTRLGRVQWRVDAPADAAATQARALAMLEPLGPTPELAWAHWHTAYNDMLARSAPSAIEHITEAGRLAEDFGDPDLTWQTGMLAGTIEVVLGNARRGMQMLSQSRDEAVRARNHHDMSVALSMMGSGGGEARLYTDALESLHEEIRHGLATDEDYGVAYARSWLARIAHEQGRWDDAVNHAELVRRTAPSASGIAVLTALSALGRVRVRRGDPGGLMLLEQMIALGATHELQHIWNAHCGRAEYLWLRGRRDEIAPLLGGIYERALATDSEWARGEIGYWMWQAGAIDEPPDNAAQPFVLEMAGDWRAAADAWREIGCPYEVALALSNGDVEAQREAVGIVAGLGARPLADRLRLRLRDAGEVGVPRGPTRSTVKNPGGLTDRQVEVLTLMAEGLSNGEIAERLFVAKKTVEHHVSAIFAKLGVDTRAKAIAATPTLLPQK